MTQRDSRPGTPAVVTWGYIPDDTVIDSVVAIEDPTFKGMTGGSQLSQLRADFDGTNGAGWLAVIGTVKAFLADGSEVTLRRYVGQIDWFSEIRDLEVVANDGEYPLLGVGLLLGHNPHISYQSGEITIE